jgi:hypothetical protein
MSMASTSKITITADTLCFVFLLFMLNMAYSCFPLLPQFTPGAAAGTVNWKLLFTQWTITTLAYERNYI